jgi:hypothetical protein
MFTQLLPYLQNCLYGENYNEFNIITNQIIDSDEDNSSNDIKTYVGRHFFVKHKFCDLDWEEYIDYILKNSTSPNYNFLAIRENTISNNASKSKTWMVISFEKDVKLSLSSDNDVNIINKDEAEKLSRNLRYKFGDVWFQVFYQHSRKKNVDAIFDAVHDKLYVFKSAKTGKIFIKGHNRFADLTNYYNWENIQTISRVLNNDCSNVTKEQLKRVCIGKARRFNYDKSKLIKSIQKKYKPSKFQ